MIIMYQYGIVIKHHNVIDVGVDGINLINTELVFYVIKFYEEI